MLGLALLLAAAPTHAASKSKANVKKVSLKKKAAPAKPAPVLPLDHSAGALSSCKKHVENMLKNPATQFVNEGAISVRKADEVRFDVAGPVRSANAGGPIGGNFACRAELIGGAVWSTKTSLDFAR